MCDAEQMILHEFTQILKRSAIKSAPQYTLAEILNEKSLTKLKELGKLHQVYRYSVLKKEALISALVSTLTEPDRVETFLSLSDDESLANLIALSKVSELPCDVVTCTKLDFYTMLGLAQIYYWDNQFIAVMPTEIRQIVKKVCTKDFMKKKHRNSLITNYTHACINLYGMISQEEFVELFNAQNSTPTSIDEVFLTLIKHMTPDSDFCFWDEYIVSSSFEEDDFEGVSYLFEASKGKPRYIPTQKELLKYTDTSYYEETIYTKKLEDHLKTICKNEYLAEDLTDEICFLASADTDFSEIMNVTASAGIGFDDMEGIQAFANIIKELKNNTRIWANKGHTPKEIYNLHIKNPVKNPRNNIIPFPTLKKSEPTIQKKVGRNDPCPCGSGKKYKKCCGR